MIAGAFLLKSLLEMEVFKTLRKPTILGQFKKAVFETDGASSITLPTPPMLRVVALADLRLWLGGPALTRIPRMDRPLVGGRA